MPERVESIEAVHAAFFVDGFSEEITESPVSDSSQSMQSTDRLRWTRGGHGYGCLPNESLPRLESH